MLVQVSGAVNPANESTASFRECVLIRHPRHGEYAFAFITGSTVLQVLPVPHLLYCNSLGMNKEMFEMYIENT